MSADGAAGRRDLLAGLCAAAPSLVAWKNLDESIAGSGDIDLVVSPEEQGIVERAARAWIAERTPDLPLVCRHSPGGLCIVVRVEGELLMLDIKTRGTWRSGRVFDAADLAPLSSVDDDGIRRLRPGAEAVLTVVMNGMAPGGRSRPGRLDPERVAALATTDPGGVERAADLLGPAAGAARRVVRRFARGRWSRPAAVLVQLVIIARIVRWPRPALDRLWFRAKVQRTCRGLKRELGDDPSDALLTHWLPRHADHTAASTNGPGRVVMIAGPDGAGKTSLVLGLLRGSLSAVPTKRVHHRDGVSILPARKNVGPASKPHRHAPYPVPLSIAKVLYIWADIVVGWFIRVRPFIRSGGWVVMERAWWDMAVDQRRYRLQGVAWLVRALGRFVPKPDVVFMMTAPAEVIHGRKAELPVDELERQLKAWPSAIPAGARVATLDVRNSPEDVVSTAEAAITGFEEFPGVHWVALPPRGPRFWIPRGPRPVTRGALGIYHPLTRTGRIALRAARAAAGLGLFRFLPRRPPPLALGLASEHLADAAGVAIARATHAGRFIAIGLDGAGKPTTVVKGATDERGRSALADEASALTSFARHLTGPVSAPLLRAKSDGILVLEPVAWRVRRDATALPEVVAEALGRLWARGDGTTGPSHGDLAPWNILRTADGWVVIDWERGGDAPAFHDVAHHFVQATAYLASPPTTAIADGLRGSGPVAAAIAAWARGAGVDPAGARDAFIAVLREPPHPSEADDPKAVAARAVKARLLETLERSP